MQSLVTSHLLCIPEVFFSPVVPSLFQPIKVCGALEIPSYSAYTFSICSLSFCHLSFYLYKINALKAVTQFLGNISKRAFGVLETYFILCIKPKNVKANF